MILVPKPHIIFEYGVGVLRGGYWRWRYDKSCGLFWPSTRRVAYNRRYGVDYLGFRIMVKGVR